MYTEDELLPISALQHLIFCERQCALIHVERLWAENRLTVEGRHLHERADSPTHETRGDVRTVRSLPLRSLQLGITGQADVVEFHRDENTTVIPVEYKRGKPKKDDSDRVQLCAQALCLEEMLERPVAKGQLFYGARKRRTEVLFEDSLRMRTKDAIVRLRQMLDDRETPPAIREKKCDSCSLIYDCLPDATNGSRSASRFMSRQLVSHLRSEGPRSDVDPS
ncbi:CRISPR-associated protein Cas4 [Planctomycetota bacterium]